jgi:hypothetical protein
VFILMLEFFFDFCLGWNKIPHDVSTVRNKFKSIFQRWQRIQQFSSDACKYIKFFGLEMFSSFLSSVTISIINRWSFIILI